MSLRYLCTKLFTQAFAALQGFLSLSVFPPGSKGYELLTLLYVRYFDALLRQPIPAEQRERILAAGRRQHAQGERESDVLPREQDPSEVGRRRRPMHCTARSYATRAAALAEHTRRCREGYRALRAVEEAQDVLMLTGRAGEPDTLSPWQFALIGDPFSPLPQHLADWLSPHTQPSSAAHWHSVALPNHWQLQGFDVPLYTNTAYPFRLDPPFTVRDGVYSLPLCDAGLGATHCERVHEKEPGVNATGLFRRTFSLPPAWVSALSYAPTHTTKRERAPDRVLLVFEGVDASLTVYLDGEFVGYSEDSCLRAEFDITDLLMSHTHPHKEKEEHLLCVQVSRFCSGSYLEDQDKWNLSGIYREVYLLRKPHSCVSDVEFTCDITFESEPEIKTESERETGRDAPRALSAALSVSVLAEGVHTRVDEPEAVLDRSASPHAVRVELWETQVERETESAVPVAVSVCELFPQSRSFSRSRADALLDVDVADREMCALRAPGLADLVLNVTSPALWSAENPQLYTLVVTLFPSLVAAQGALPEDELHTLCLTVGIKEVSFARDPLTGTPHCLLVNRRRVTIAGANRLEFDAHTGRAVSEEMMRTDALLLKRLNFNAVRSAHYPQHPLWLRLCDELGLYFVDEANIETHGFQALGQPVGFLSHDINWRGALASRVARMYERDKNHACVIGWSLGNESGHGPTHDLLADWLRVRDPRRFVQYESGGACTTATDIICPMYQHPEWCVAQCADPKERPVILCEYAHAMGNSGGSLSHYWRLFRDNNGTLARVQGGFIWDFVDQGLALSPGENKGERKFIYGGDFGESPHSKNFCCNGLTAPDRAPHPHAYEAAFLQCPVRVSWSPTTGGESEKERIVLRVCNERCFLSLADVSLSITPVLAVQATQQPVLFPSFELSLSDLKPGAQRDFDLSSLLAQSARDCVAGCALREDSTPLAWLRVTVSQRRGSAAWCAEQDAVLLRTSLSSPAVAALLASHCVLSKTSSDSEDSPSFSTSPINQRETEKEREPKVMAVTEDEHSLCVRWTNSNSSLSFDKRTACLVQWTASNGESLLCGPLEVCLYRALTDNDRGGAMLSYASQWRTAGYHCLSPRKANVVCKRASNDSDDVCVIARFAMEPSDAEVQSGLSIPCEISFHCCARTHAVRITSTISPPAGFPALPRVGLRLAFSAAWDSVQWLGLGPHEAYDDRKSSVYLDVFQSTVEELHSHYVFPQENGRRADPRWIMFEKSGSHSSTSSSTAAATKGSIVILPGDNTLSDWQRSASAYGFSASRFSLEELDAKEHDYELSPAEDERVFVHVDSRSMGVGGYDSWTPNVRDEYLIHPNGEPLVTQMTLIHRIR